MRLTTWHQATTPEGLIKTIARLGENPPGAYDRKLRLFACACVRRHWDRVLDARDRRIVELAEASADSGCSPEALEASREKSTWKRGEKGPLWARFIADAAQVCAKRNVVQAALNCTHWLTNAASFLDNDNPTLSTAAWAAYTRAREAEQRHHVAVLHDLFGDPFDPVDLDPAVRTWNKGRTVTLARAIYDQHTFERLPELADVLVRAGCADARVLSHCHGPGPHSRGCWVVDALLGKHTPLDPAPRPRPRLLPANDDLRLPYDSYLVLWTQARCDSLKRHGQLGTRPAALFGGPHLSEPRFSTYRVRAGDYILPIGVRRGVVYVISRMKVRHVLPLPDYIADYPAVFTGCDVRKPPSDVLRNWLRLHPEKGFLAPTCTDEVAVIEDATPLRLDVALPPAVLARLVFKSGTRESTLGGIVDGKLTRSLSLQGLYRRLSKQSALEIEAALRGAAAD